MKTYTHKTIQCGRCNNQVRVVVESESSVRGPTQEEVRRELVFTLSLFGANAKGVARGDAHWLLKDAHPEFVHELPQMNFGPHPKARELYEVALAFEMGRFADCMTGCLKLQGAKDG